MGWGLDWLARLARLALLADWLAGWLGCLGLLRFGDGGAVCAAWLWGARVFWMGRGGESGDKERKRMPL